MPNRGWQHTLVLVLLLGLFAGHASARGVLQPLETRVWDEFFRYRAELNLNPPVDDRILLVLMDAELFEEIGQPSSRWCDEYAKVVEQLLEDGAKVVALDLLFRPSLEKLPWEQASLINDEIAELAFLVLEREVVMVDTHRQREGDLRSTDILQAAAEDNDHIGYNNLHTDDDGLVRRFHLYFNSFEPFLNRNLFGVVARVATGQRVTEKDNPWVTEPHDSLRINYPGPPEETFRSVPMSQLLRGKKVESQGKICLVGPAHDSWNDLHETPLGTSPGLEIHAAALNTVLTQQFLRLTPAWAHYLLCLAGCLAAYALASRTPGWVLVLGSGAAFAGYPLLCFGAFLQASLLMPVILPLLATVFCGAGTYLARYRAMENSRRYVTGVLGRFVSPQVMQELLASPDNLQLGGRRRRITILFADINNFTPLCEKKSPEEVIEMLNEFFQEMLDVIFRYGGTVKQFVGDEIMVLYGAPDEMPDHAAKAVLTAREMVQRLSELKAKRGEGTGFYEIKIGIHTGDVVVGNIGTQQRSEYAAVGDAVNTAARIESLTKDLGEPILVSDDTRKECENALPDLTFESKGQRKFKGKKGRMKVFGLRWES